MSIAKNLTSPDLGTWTDPAFISYPDGEKANKFDSGGLRIYRKFLCNNRVLARATITAHRWIHS